MRFRFRRSIKILPGIRINLGKKSASVSLGVRGAHVTLRPGHTARTTVGLPGTGLSYTEGGEVQRSHLTHSEPLQAAQPASDADLPPKGRAWRGWLWMLMLAAIAIYVVRRSL